MQEVRKKELRGVEGFAHLIPKESGRAVQGGPGPTGLYHPFDCIGTCGEFLHGRQSARRGCACILIVVTEALFIFNPDEKLPQSTGVVGQPIRDDHVTAIREAFTLAGIDRQERRQQITQSCVVRPLESLRDLTAAEAHRVLERIKDVTAAKPRPAGASEWDLREEDTWIDTM